MPRLKPAPRSAIFEELKKDDRAQTERADCAVMAVAAAAGVSYAVAHEAHRIAGRKAKSGTPTWITEKALASLGFKMVPWRYDRRQAKLASYPIKAAYITTHHPHRLHAHWKDEGTLLFRASGHILCVKDGVNHDWSHKNSLRVIEIYQVEAI